MMKWIITLVLLFPSLSFADAAPSKYEELRKKRPEIQAYFESLLVRKMANDVAVAMTINGFSDTEIQNVLGGASFRNYSTRVMETPRMKQALQRFLNRLLKPGVLEVAFEKRAEELAAQRNASFALAIQELISAQQRLHLDEKPIVKLSFWERAWRYVTRDLLP